MVCFLIRTILLACDNEARRKHMAYGASALSQARRKDMACVFYYRFYCNLLS